MLLCKYKDIFGKVNTGLHKYRICNIAIVDLVLTGLLAILIKNKMKSDLNLFLILAILIILSLFIHYLFCVKTTLTTLFFKM